MRLTDPRCGVSWTQHGNSSGHCSGCHRTFYGLTAFDNHFRRRPDGGPECTDPAEHEPGKSGATFWADHEGQWHYGAPMTADEYQHEREKQADAMRTRAASAHQARASAAPQARAHHRPHPDPSDARRPR